MKWIVYFLIVLFMLAFGPIRVEAEEYPLKDLPQVELSGQHAKTILAYCNEQNMPVYGTYENEDDSEFMIWYTAQENNHSCFHARTDNNALFWRLITPETCKAIYDAYEN